MRKRFFLAVMVFVCLAAPRARALETARGLPATPPFEEDPAKEPPDTMTYRFRVLEEPTGAPAAGVPVTVEFGYRRYDCSQFDTMCTGCTLTTAVTSRLCTSDANGEGIATFTGYHCRQYSTNPPRWETIVPQGWARASLTRTQQSAAGGEWFCTSRQAGPPQYDGTLTVVHEDSLASWFRPVLHRHAGLERQAELGDIVALSEESATLGAYDLTRNLYYGDVPPMHATDTAHQTWCSFGRKSVAIQVFWEFDIGDGARNAGAAPGTRPVYFHAFPWQSGVVIQYWLWFNANDTASQWSGLGAHEGDWEHVDVYVTYQQGTWTPQSVNFSQHAGGEALEASACWWSSSTSDSYAGLELGSAPGRTHPHVWVASNSHALYNRFDPTYRLAYTPPGGGCDGALWDFIDDNPCNTTRGAHRLFTYDRLAPLGEYYTATTAHGQGWYYHVEGGRVEPLRFIGRFGEGSTSCPPGCPETVCGIGAAIGCVPFTNYCYPLSESPYSPYLQAGWSTFHLPSEGRWWGNPSSGSNTIEYRQNPFRGNELGEFVTCWNGKRQGIEFDVPARRSWLAGFARITTLSGDPVFLDADAGGVIPLGAPVEGNYQFRARRIGGAGTVTIDIYGAGYEQSPDDYDARDLTATITPGGDLCATGVRRPSADRHTLGAAARSRNPARGEIFIEVRRGLVEGRLDVFDVSGRRVRSLPVPAGARLVRWDGRDDAGRRAGSGVYLLRLASGGVSEDFVRVTIAR